MLNKTPYIFSLCALLTFSAACGESTDPTHSGEFTIKDDINANTTAMGLVQDNNAQPVQGAFVYIMSQAKIVASTTTNAMGTFNLTGPFSGEVQLIINDSNGYGALQPFKLFEGGENDLGTVTISPLAKLNGIVDIPGIGFEERITRDIGNYDHPVYNSDASTVFAARKLDGVSTWTIVKIDTATGNETTLLEKIDLHTSNSPGYRKALNLYDDNILYFIEDRAHKLYDVTQDKIVFDSSQQPGVLNGTDYQTPKLTNDTIYISLVHESKSLKHIGAKLKERFYGYNIKTGAITKGTILPWAYGYNRPLSQHKNTITYASEPLCMAYINDDNELSETDCIEGSNIYTYDMVAKRRNIIFTKASVTHDNVSGDGTTLVASKFFPQDSGITKITAFIINTQSGQVQQVEWPQFDVNTYNLKVLAINHDGSKAFVSINERSGNAAHFFELDTGTLTPKAVDMSFTVDGTIYQACNYRTGSSCTYTYAQNKLRVHGPFLDKNNTWQGASFEDILTTPPQLYPLPNEEDYRELALYPTIVHNPNTNAFVVRDTSTGFFQVYLHDTALKQRTFLTADHKHVQFSADGKNLFYFTRDPISGYIQLFRLDLTTPVQP